MAFDPPLGSTSPAVLLDNATRLDELVNGPAGTVNDRAGQPLDSWRKIIAAILESSAAAMETIRLTLIPLGEQYATEADAQAAINNGTIPAGSYFYVRSTDDSALAVEYRNVSGTAQPTGRKMPSQDLLNQLTESLGFLLPLADTTRFFKAGVTGTPHEAINAEDIFIDAENNLQYWIKDGVRQYFLPVRVPTLEADTVLVDGIAVDPAAIPPAVLATNLLGLAQSSKFLDPEAFQPGGAYEGWEGYDNIWLDKSGNIQGYTHDGASYLLLPLSVPELSAKKIRLDGEDLRDVIARRTETRIPFTEMVDGKSQIMLLNNQTGQLSQVTDGTANETDPVVDGGGVLSWTSDRDSSVPGGKFYLAESGKIHPVISRRVLAGWGDSFMENPVFMNTLHALTGLPAYNFGKSGIRSTAVAARQGGEPFYCMPVDGVIPASGTVNLIPNVPGPHASASNGAMAAIKCQLAGVDGTFNWDGLQASFTRDTEGSETAVSILTPLFVYPYTTADVVGSTPAGTLYPEHDEAILILTCGRNNTTSVSEVVNNVKNIVSYLKPVGALPCICPPVYPR
ncbi:flagellar biosynthesis, cell-distal portion of basal-body rod [Klebsiella pneumoniae]|nr:flagellar biosynthesis, cell-distal portion of basal-body rod [Klebsiella pneumoniae]